MNTGFCPALRIATASVLGLTLLAALDVHAQVVYSNGFSSAVGPEWSSTLRSTTPTGGRQFLGEFGGHQTVSLTLSNLPSHGQLTVSFDLFILKSWDGSTDPNHPDIFDLTVRGETNLLHATFGNNSATEFKTQSYPDNYPGPLHAGGTGASEMNTLGYAFFTGTTTFSDAVYQVSFTLPHATSSVIFDFSSSLDQALYDESWGLDNVVVAVPEPSSLALCGFAAIYLMALRRRPWRR